MWHKITKEELERATKELPVCNGGVTLSGGEYTEWGTRSDHGEYRVEKHKDGSFHYFRFLPS